jgi:hypothetical protein
LEQEKKQPIIVSITHTHNLSTGTWYTGLPVYKIILIYVVMISLIYI